MDNVGAEVGQKMRSAIKAKLLELNCYVDDELPDYIMVMVANRRTKAQMKEDLNLFLNTKTEAFVDWLHIVLKKLKEVTVTNPEVYKRVTKRKSSSDQGDIKVKKEKKSKKINEDIKKEPNNSLLTDDLSVIPNKLCDKRTITLIEENKRDEFDIPLLSDVNTSSEKDLEEIEQKIRSVKSRLGILVDSEVEDLELKLEKDESEEINDNLLSTSDVKPEQSDDDDDDDDDNFNESQMSITNKVSLTPERQRKHSPITFESEKKTQKKPSILQRLGERISISDKKSYSLDHKNREERFSSSRSSRDRYSDRKKDSREDRRYRRDNERNRRGERKSVERHSIPISRGSTESPKPSSRSDKNQVGVMSKIHVPEKTPEVVDREDELKTREVRSMVQVKPRVLSSSAPQPNKNLLLKAVEEAHRSVSQTTNIKPRVSAKLNGDVSITRKLSHREKVKLRNIILAQVSREDTDSNDEDKEFEYVPKPITKRNCTELPKYVPSSRQSVDELSEPEKISVKPRISAKARLEGRRSPSPIIFDESTVKALNKVEVPDSLSMMIRPPISIENKDKCKYWPNCRQGDNCEFVHPVSKCEMFPNCQYGDSCLYIHPSCKFGSSCTKRDCAYNHFNKANLIAAKGPVIQPQTCKFYPKCTNSTCPFYHPKPCRFGKYCKNQTDCPFSHVSAVNKSSLTWRSKI